MVPEAPPATVAPSQGVLTRMARPYDPATVVAALCGRPHRAARQLVGTVLSTSAEAEALLDAMPNIVRSLSIATTDRAERCYGELRGPVLWSETMSARSASAGDPGLFVCSTTTKAYDTPENRLLKAALAAIERAGRDATLGFDSFGDEVLSRARQNEYRARHLLEHRTLSALPITVVTGRSMRRTRAGSRRGTYQPAIALLRRSQEPIDAGHLAPWLNDAVVADHELLVQALDALDRQRGGRAELRSSQGGLAAGPIRYDHLTGVTIGGAPVTDAAAIERALAASAS